VGRQKGNDYYLNNALNLSKEWGTPQAVQSYGIKIEQDGGRGLVWCWTLTWHPFFR